MARFSLLILLLASSFFAQKIDNAEIDYYVRAAINAIGNERYEKADSILCEFKERYPRSPFPFAYLAALDINRKYNFNSTGYNEKIYANLAKAEEISDSLIYAQPDNIWNYYSKALTLGYWAYFEGLKGNYFSAFDYGSEALDYYEKCLALDPDFTDALIADAIYDYWISEKLGWLPFVSDNRTKAIEILKKAVKKKSYNENLAAVSLFWILMNEKEYQSARQLIKNEYEKFPDNRYIIMAYANVEKRFDKKKAVELYEKALLLTVRKKRENKINEIILRHKIAMLEFQLKNYDNVLEHCNRVLSYNLTKYEKEKLNGRLAKITELKKNAEREKNNVKPN